MSKPFNIHDWQAKQRQQRLEEIRAQDVPGTAAWGGRAGLKVGGSYADNDWKGLDAEVAKYIGLTFASWMSPSHPEFSKEYAKAPYFDKLVMGIMKIVDNYEGEELDEANMTGTGASFNAGNSMAYGSGNIFKKKQKYVEQEEEEIEKDAQKLADHPLLDRINTRDEWEDVMQTLIDHGKDDITQVNTSTIKTFLMNALSNINKPKA